MKKTLLLCFSLLVATMIACQFAVKVENQPMLEPGDEFGGMRISTGTPEAVPLLAFCQSVVEKKDTTSFDCRVPPASKLAIGYVLGAGDSELQALDWSALTWEFSVDGRAVNLRSFGIYRGIQPALVPTPSPYREIFTNIKAWDVVLVDPAPGAHTITGKAYNGEENYAWFINFTVEELVVSQCRMST